MRVQVSWRVAQKTMERAKVSAVAAVQRGPGMIQVVSGDAGESGVEGGTEGRAEKSVKGRYVQLSVESSEKSKTYSQWRGE